MQAFFLINKSLKNEEQNGKSEFKEYDNCYIHLVAFPSSASSASSAGLPSEYSSCHTPWDLSIMFAL